MRTALSTSRDDSISQYNIPSAFNPIGILSSPVYLQSAASFHPPKSTAGQLWRIFVDVVDTLFKLVHIPTAEITVYTVINDPGVASAESLALCYAIYYAATVALDEQDDCVQVLGETWNGALLRYKAGLEQAFAEADLLENPTVVMLQAMAIYLVRASTPRGTAFQRRCLSSTTPCYISLTRALPAPAKKKKKKKTD